MTSTEFISKLQNAVDDYKTVYMWGTFGAPVTESLIASKAAQYPSWYTAARQAALRALIGKGYFAFDCVGLIKGLLWGWNGDASKTYGGAVYASNSVPDTNDVGMINSCSDVSTDFSKIVPGAAVWLSGHIGLYIGDGKVIECTPSWTNGVQVTACKNISTISGLNARAWTRHGKLPYITYEAAAQVTTTKEDDMTGKEIYEKLTEYLRSESEVPDWAKAELQEAVGMGITDGTRPMELIPRYQAAIMAKRAADTH